MPITALMPREQELAEREVGRQQRDDFRQWLAARRTDARKLRLQELLTRYGGTISLSAAYRIAVSLRLRGRRQHATRYGPFWDTINWRLPDSALSAIWGVTRGNLRQRRVRLSVGDPSYDGRLHRQRKQYQAEVAHEQQKALRFTGPRPR